MKPVLAAVDEHSRANRPHQDSREQGIFQRGAGKFPGHVLVVDDEPLIRWSVAESLSDVGFDVEQASNAAAALRCVTTASAPFSVVVLDLRLPDMDDLSLLKTLRQLLPQTGLILMTAFGTPEIVQEATELGATVLGKPFELDDLRRLVLDAGVSH